MQTLTREVREEVGLDLPENAICHAVQYRSFNQRGYMNWFYVARLDVVSSFPPQLIEWMDLQTA